MRRTIVIIILVLVVSLVHISLINKIAVSNYSNENTKIINKGGNELVKISVGDRADVTVLKPRWYGEINEIHGKNTTFISLSLFKLINMPLKVNNKNYLLQIIIINAILITIVIASLIIDIIQSKRRKYHEINLQNYDNMG